MDNKIIFIYFELKKIVMPQEKLPLISVVIPVKNEAKFLERSLQSHFNQTLSGEAEVIVIDSGSTDGSLEIAEKYPVRLYKIKPEDFSFSLTRQMGGTVSEGKICFDDKW